jgi:triacylglycerol lipase
MVRELEPAEAIAPAERARLPVVYVPGFLSPFTYAWYFERSFEKQSYEFHQLGFPRLSTGDMVEMAGMLQAQVEALAGEFGRVNLVCHSAGGLVARYYLQKMSRGAAVSSVVFLGTPHRGTLAAYPGLAVRACRQMRPGSAFLSGLDDGGLGRILVNRSLSIYSNHDFLVLPTESARLAGARNLLLRGMLGHAMPLDPRAFGFTLAFIEEMAPA